MPRLPRAHPFTFPIEAAFATAAACITLCHRLPMLVMLPTQNEVERRMELARMIAEKAGAIFEGSLDAGTAWMRLFGAAVTSNLSSQQLASAPLLLAAAGLRPSFRRVRSNARRLNRRAVRRARR